MNVSAASLAPDSSVRKATPSDITERTARSGAVVETIFLSRPRRAQCTSYPYSSFFFQEDADWHNDNDNISSPSLAPDLDRCILLTLEVFIILQKSLHHSLL